MIGKRLLSGVAVGTVVWLFLASALVTSRAWQPGDPWTAEYMWRRYVNTSKNCPASTEAPEYSCTGIRLRATSPQKEPDGGWIPEHKSFPHDPKAMVSAGGVSFSYIRADAKFGRLAFDFQNGFTLLPFNGKYKAPGDKMRLTVLCAFPLDASTDNRTQAGCGPRPRMQAGRPCRAEGIVTAEQWMANYRRYASQPITTFAYQYQCGFNMQEGYRHPQDFTTVLSVMKSLGQFNQVNELRIKTWADSYNQAASAGVARALPIESFFYIAGTPDGLNRAREDQQKFYRLTGEFVPIVRIKMPTSAQDDFDFAYDRADQSRTGIKIPEFPKVDPLACDATSTGHFDTQCRQPK